MDEERSAQDQVQRAIGGDRAALTMLLMDSALPLHRYLAAKIPSNLRSSLDAEDIAQEAHVEVYRHIAEFDPRGPDSFSRWLKTIALRKLRRAITRHRTQRRGGGQAGKTLLGKKDTDSVCMLLDMISASDSTPSRCMARNESIEAVQAGLDFLSAPHRQAVSMVYLEGAAVAEVAKVMGRSEQAVHNLCNRAKQRLHDILGSRSHYLSSRE